MQALIDIRSPSGTLASLREIHDTIEGHIHSLASLGKSQDTYSSMLVTIILGENSTQDQTEPSQATWETRVEN